MGLLFKVNHCNSCGGCLADPSPIVLPPSPTPHLRRTRQPPNMVEMAVIEESSQNIWMTVTHIDEEITKTAAIISDLEIKRDALHRMGMENQSFLAPIRRLPSEILENIFMLCLPSLLRYSSFDRTKAPLVLMQVCMAWRYLAHSSQRLWARFTISCRHPCNEALAEAWLSHAKSIPLSPTFRLPDGNVETTISMWPVISQAIRHCDRWQHLVMMMPASTFDRFHSIERRLPLLETLSIDVRSLLLEPTQVFKFAPRLHRLQLKSGIRPKMIDIPWYQLTSFKGYCDSLAICFSTLSLMPILANLTLYASSNKDLSIPSTTIVLPHLISLEVDFTFDKAELFERLRCPILNTLRVMAKGLLWESDRFIEFLSCCPSLHQLSIARMEVGVSVANMIPCLEAIPSLTTLILDGAYPPWPLEDIWRGLTVTDSITAGGLLPALENLRVAQMPLDSLLFARMVRSRMAPQQPGIAQLRTLTLSIPPRLLRFDQKSMRDICANLERGIGIKKLCNSFMYTATLGSGPL